MKACSVAAITLALTVQSAFAGGSGKSDRDTCSDGDIIDYFEYAIKDVSQDCANFSLQEVEMMFLGFLCEDDNNKHGDYQKKRSLGSKGNSKSAPKMSGMSKDCTVMDVEVAFEEAVEYIADDCNIYTSDILGVLEGEFCECSDSEIIEGFEEGIKQVANICDNLDFQEVKAFFIESGLLCETGAGGSGKAMENHKKRFLGFESQKGKNTCSNYDLELFFFEIIFALTDDCSTAPEDAADVLADEFCEDNKRSDNTGPDNGGKNGGTSPDTDRKNGGGTAPDTSRKNGGGTAPDTGRKNGGGTAPDSGRKNGGGTAPDTGRKNGDGSGRKAD